MTARSRSTPPQRAKQEQAWQQRQPGANPTAIVLVSTQQLIDVKAVFAQRARAQPASEVTVSTVDKHTRTRFEVGHGGKFIRVHVGTGTSGAEQQGLPPIGQKVPLEFGLFGVAQDRPIDRCRKVIVGEVLRQARIDDQCLGAEVLYLELVRMNQPSHRFQGVRFRNERLV